MPPGPRQREEFRARGWTDSQLDEALRRRRLIQIQRGVLLPQQVEPTLFVHAEAATRAVRRSVVGRRTAAELMGLEGLPVARAGSPPVELWVPALSTTRRREGLTIRQTSLDPGDVTTLGGVPVTTPARTVVDLARIWPLPTAVVVADAALRQTSCTHADLVTALDRQRGLRGIRRAREALRLTQPGTRSCGETRARLVIVRSELPEPEVGIQIRNSFGDLIAEADMGYRHWLIWIEYDGFDVHTERDTFRLDRTRQRFLERRGWFVLRMVDSDVHQPAAFLSDLGAAIEDAPRRIASMAATRSPEVGAARRVLGLDDH
jgi:hypothetical protein